jgi:hypothetical protein
MGVAGDQGWQAAECLVPGMTRPVAEAMAVRIAAELARSPYGQRVAFLGSLLMLEDEVLICIFAGAPADVRAVSVQAGVPFERILSCVPLCEREEHEGTPRYS